MSALEDILLLGNDTRLNNTTFENALEDLETSIQAHKKSIQALAPKDPIIGDPNGAVLNAKNEILGGAVVNDVEDDGGVTEDDATRQQDDSDGGMGDIVGQLDDSGEELQGASS